jgi:hypothetical protein
MKENLEETFGFIVGGAGVGASVSTTFGGMGLVGKFGGIGIGVGTMMGVGAVTGAAIYGASKAIEDRDAMAISAIGLGTLGGAGVSAAVGGMGLSVGGTAFGIGMGAMAATGGVVGLGIYGLCRIFQGTNSQNKLYSNILTLEQITKEYEEEKCWANLEVEEELQALKATISLNSCPEKLLSSIESLVINPSDRNLSNLPTINVTVTDYQKEKDWIDLEIEEELTALKAII